MKKNRAGLNVSPFWAHCPGMAGPGPDARPFADPNGQNTDQKRVRLGRPVGVILSVYSCSDMPVTTNVQSTWPLGWLN